MKRGPCRAWVASDLGYFLNRLEHQKGASCTSHLRLAVLKQALVRAAQRFVRNSPPQRRAQLVELLRRAPSHPPRPFRVCLAAVTTTARHCSHGGGHAISCALRQVHTAQARAWSNPAQMTQHCRAYQSPVSPSPFRPSPPSPPRPLRVPPPCPLSLVFGGIEHNGEHVFLLSLGRHYPSKGRAVVHRLQADGILIVLGQP